MPLPIAPLIGAGASLLGNAVSNIFGGSQAKKQRRHQRRLAEHSYSRDLEMWNRQNAYNHPKAQMSRLKEAGINPHMVHGSGQVANTAGQMPKYNVPNAEYFKPDIRPGEAIGEYHRIALMSSQDQAIQQRILNDRQRQINDAAKLAGILSGNRKKRYEADLIRNTMEYQEDAKRLEVDRIRSQIQNVNKKTATETLKQQIMHEAHQISLKLKNQEFDLRKRGEWHMLGANLRLMKNVWKEAGLDIKNFYREVEHHFLRVLPGKIFNDGLKLFGIYED